MSALDRLNFILATFGRLFVGLFNVRLWPPFLIFLLVMLAEIWALSNMFSPLFSGWLVPLAQWLGNDQVTHYPQHLIFLPVIFQSMNLVFSFFLDSLLSGAAVVMFAAYFNREKVSFGAGLRAAWKQYPKLLLVWIVIFLPILLMFQGLPGLFRDFIAGAPRRQMALMLGLEGLQILITALFIYVVPNLLLRGMSLGRAFVENFSMFFRNFFTTVIFVGVPQLIVFPLILMLQNTGTFVEKFNPEVIVWLTVIFALALTLSNFFVLGAIIRFFRDAAEE